MVATWAVRPGAQLRALPHGPGVYRFRDERGRVLYIGRATDLRDRVGSYWSGLGDRRHLTRTVAAVRRIEALACASVHEAAWLERLLLEHLQSGPGLPRGNRVAGGAENPLWLLLDRRSRTAGLSTGHDPGPVPAGVTAFGPHLGGLQVRRAVTGLHRVLPLGYTGTGLSGSAVGMAALRAVGPSDRERLADELARVLDGDPDAVARAVSALTRLRDEASAGRAYELAGRITGELAAVGWIGSRQRVCRPGSGDHQVAGWADGMLVRLDVVDGRVVDWRQRRCTELRSSAVTASTRPEWVDFARDNARLAAALTAAAGSAPAG